MSSGPAGVSNHQADAGGFLGRQSELAVVRSYSIVIGFTSQSARHATTAPTCPRRSRCAPKLSTNAWIDRNGFARGIIPVRVYPSPVKRPRIWRPCALRKWATDPDALRHQDKVDLYGSA